MAFKPMIVLIGYVSVIVPREGGAKNPKTFADIINGSPLAAVL